MPVDYTGFLFPKKTPPASSKAGKPLSKKAREEQCRDAVWARDGNRDRATGRLLWRTHEDPACRGQVHHLKTKGAHPELKYTLSNLVLLSDTNHRLADARGNKRLQILGDDANGPLTFVMHNKRGRELWRRTSSPPGSGSAGAGSVATR